VSRRLSKVRLEFTVLAGEEGKLFGSVTNSDIQQQLAAQGFSVDRRKVDLPDPIKQTGSYEVPVRLHREVIAKIKVDVVASAVSPPSEVEEEEAEEPVVRADEDEDEREE
jgi:large subunit ribosomal protein L9